MAERLPSQPLLSRSRSGRDGARRPSPLRLDLTAHAGRAHVAALRRLLLQAHPALGAAGQALTDLSVVLVGDRRMSRLHQDHLGIAGPTDVLSFELDHDEKGRVRGGEVILCVPEAARAAAKHKTSVRRELLLYALHGLLHLCGWDDRTAGDFDRMHRMEDRILKRLGIGAVFFGQDARSRSSP